MHQFLTERGGRIRVRQKVAYDSIQMAAQWVEDYSNSKKRCRWILYSPMVEQILQQSHLATIIFSFSTKVYKCILLPIDCMKWNNNRNRLIFAIFCSRSISLALSDWWRDCECMEILSSVCTFKSIQPEHCAAFVEPQWTGIGQFTVKKNISVIDSFEWMFMVVFLLSRSNWICSTFDEIGCYLKNFLEFFFWYVTAILVDSFSRPVAINSSQTHFPLGEMKTIPVNVLQ